MTPSLVRCGVCRCSPTVRCMTSGEASTSCRISGPYLRVRLMAISWLADGRAIPWPAEHAHGCRGASRAPGTEIRPHLAGGGARGIEWQYTRTIVLVRDTTCAAWISRVRTLWGAPCGKYGISRTATTDPSFFRDVHGAARRGTPSHAAPSPAEPARSHSGLHMFGRGMGGRSCENMTGHYAQAVPTPDKIPRVQRPWALDAFRSAHHPTW